MTQYRHGLEVGREALAALAVLALVFLSFAHVPPAQAATTASLAVASADWCGAPLSPGAPERAPCPACRIGAGLALPPPPAGLVAPCLTQRVVYLLPARALPPVAARAGPQARAPPQA